MALFRLFPAGVFLSAAGGVPAAEAEIVCDILFDEGLYSITDLENLIRIDDTKLANTPLFQIEPRNPGIVIVTCVSHSHLKVAGLPTKTRLESTIAEFYPYFMTRFYFLHRLLELPGIQLGAAMVVTTHIKDRIKAEKDRLEAEETGLAGKQHNTTSTHINGNL